MLGRQTSGSVICTSCGTLVGVSQTVCPNCGRRNPGLWGFAPALRAFGQDLGFVPFTIGTCVILYGLTLLSTVASGGSLGMGGIFTMLSPDILALATFGASGGVPVFTFDRWWTVLSAGWLHGGLLHILFNMLWVRQLAPTVADLYGPGRLMIIYTASSVTGFALSSFASLYLPRFFFLSGSQFTVGASAAIFGLLGAMVYYGRRGGSSHIGGQALSYALILGLFGFLMPGIDNYAHGGGFAGGWLTARFLDPLKSERIDHLILGLACLGASLLAVAVSFFAPLPNVFR